jgi:hypothetical protein
MGIWDGKGIERRRDTREHGNMNKEHHEQTMMDGTRITSLDTMRSTQIMESLRDKGRWKKEQLLCPDHTSINTQN